MRWGNNMTCIQLVITENDEITTVLLLQPCSTILSYHCDIITYIIILITHWCIYFIILCKRLEVYGVLCPQATALIWLPETCFCWQTITCNICTMSLFKMFDYALSHLYPAILYLHWHTNLHHCSRQKHQMQLPTLMCHSLSSWSRQDHCSYAHVFCIHVRIGIGAYMLPYICLKTLVGGQNGSRLAVSANISNCVYSISSLHIYQFLYTYIILFTFQSATLLTILPYGSIILWYKACPHQNRR